MLERAGDGVKFAFVEDGSQQTHWLPSVFSTSERPCSGGCSSSLLYVFGGSLGSGRLEM